MKVDYYLAIVVYTRFKSMICKSSFISARNQPRQPQVNPFNFLSLSVFTMALDATQTPYSTEPQTTHSPDITTYLSNIHHPALN